MRLGSALRLPKHVLQTVIRLPPISWATGVTTAVTVRSIDLLITVVARLSNGPTAKSPHLQGVSAPRKGNFVERQAKVTGRMPPDLRGMMLTICANTVFLPDGGCHMFEGDGALTSVRIFADGSASFAFTQLETEKLRFERRIGRSTVLSFTALKGVPGLVLALLEASRKRLRRGRFSRSTANTNVEVFGSPPRAFALWEVELPYVLKPTADGTALQAERRLRFTEYDEEFSAHPKVHASNGCWYSVSYCLESKEQDVNIVVLDEKLNYVRHVPVQLGRKPMIHDCAITEKYLLIFDSPLLFDPSNVIKKDKDVFQFERENPTRIGLFPVDARHESEIVWFDVPTMFSFHSFFAYDTPDGVVLYIAQYMSMKLAKFDFSYESNPFAFVRYDFNVKKMDVTAKSVDMPLREHFDIGHCVIDFMFYNRAVPCSEVKYMYATVYTEFAVGDFRLKGLIKYNLETSSIEGAIQWDGHALGESTFVLGEGAEKEDEGYLLTFVSNGKGSVVLHICDAQTMNPEPLCAVHAPDGVHIPTGFHSQFIPDSTLAKL